VGAPGGIDARGDRLVQALVGVLLLAAFVFRVPVIVPIVAILQAVSAGFGVRANPFHQAFTRWVGPRIGPSDAMVDEQIVRGQDAFAAGLLAVASLAFLVNIPGLGWLFVIAEAVIAAVAATTLVHLGERAVHRLIR
jgi:Domain of unknown function (DUF4395)